jgi:homoserine kinase
VQKIKIRLPATLTDLGGALHAFGLAVSLYTHVEISPRIDDKLVVETSGEGAGHYDLGLRHPVVLGMVRVFQHFERAPMGITIKVQNDIPLQSGLGAETAFMVAGILGGNNLMGSPFSRAELITMAARVSHHPDNAVSTMLGGLASSIDDDTTFLYRALPLQPFRIIIAVPKIPNHQPPAPPERIVAQETTDALRRLPMMLEALREGNIALLARIVSQSQLMRTETNSRIPGYAHVAEVARLAGVQATLTTGGGPGMVFLAEKSHDRIAEVIEHAFHNLDISARVFVLPLDTQGVVISMMQTT